MKKKIYIYVLFTIEIFIHFYTIQKLASKLIKRLREYFFHQITQNEEATLQKTISYQFLGNSSNSRRRLQYTRN